MSKSVIGGMMGILSLLGMSGCAQVFDKPVAFENGYKTSRVVATYQPKTGVGYSIKLDFPKNRYDSDRAEISDFLDDNGCDVYEGGGYAGAPAYMTCKDVKDNASAAVKLKAILPPLTELLGGLDNPIVKRKFAALHKIADSKRPQWPDTTAPDKTDPYWEFNNNMNVNGTQYMKKEVSPGKWHWVIDEKSMKAMRDYENARWQLFADLSRRKLTHDELMQVNTSTNIQNMQSYFAVDKYAELYDALVAQWELQTGRKMEGYVPLSTAKGQYNRSPQEDDSRRTVEALISTLQSMNTK